MQIHKMAVIGGTGKAGRYIVRELLHHGYSLRLLLRNSSAFTVKHSLIEIARCDARDPLVVEQTLEGCDAVVSALGQPVGETSIFSVACRNILSAMEKHGIRRFIGLTGLNVDTPGDSKSGYTASATEWMYANYPNTTADKQVEWEMLNASTMDWTLLRLPLIELTESKPHVRMSLTDCPGRKISASSLADYIAKELENPQWIRQSPFIANAG